MSNTKAEKMAGLAMEILSDEAMLVVKPIAQLDVLESSADERDLRSVEGFTAQSRRAERLAWRGVLREIAPDAEVEYTPSGAPQLKNSHYTYISVSHCRDAVAVALSCEVCGVDIERLDRNFSRIASRYVSDEEQRLCDEEWWLAAVWCAKETLYKMAGREGIDFLRDTIITGVDTSAKRIECRSVGGKPVTLSYAMPDEEHIICYKL